MARPKAGLRSRLKPESDLDGSVLWDESSVIREVGNWLEGNIYLNPYNIKIAFNHNTLRYRSCIAMLTIGDNMGS